MKLCSCGSLFCYKIPWPLSSSHCWNRWTRNCNFCVPILEHLQRGDPLEADCKAIGGGVRFSFGLVFVTLEALLLELSLKNPNLLYKESSNREYIEKKSLKEQILRLVDEVAEDSVSQKKKDLLKSTKAALQKALEAPDQISSSRSK
ncbi:hypothetical protein L1987_39671 [Smallanthus sonchifolius]|uniref:Uncharacterized protein n=1 Tax=Smallanthus sonchifolius TaxID=185202 RepID=A0ACB9HMN9_9ASTR|nr:hypothetical protein L1987_39671 [Smallanthus sonchifolius]